MSPYFTVQSANSTNLPWRLFLGAVLIGLGLISLVVILLVLQPWQPTTTTSSPGNDQLATVNLAQESSRGPAPNPNRRTGQNTLSNTFPGESPNALAESAQPQPPPNVIQGEVVQSGSQQPSNVPVEMSSQDAAAPPTISTSEKHVKITTKVIESSPEFPSEASDNTQATSEEVLLDELSSGVQRRKLLGKAKRRIRAGLYNEAFEYLEQARRIRNGAEVYSLSAEIYEKRGQYGPAISNMKQAVASSPSNATYHDALGSLYIKTGHRRTACNSFRKALSLNQRHLAARRHIKRYCSLARNPNF